MDWLQTLDWGEWGPPLAVIAVGLLVGFALVSRIGEEDAAVKAQSRRLDLENERAAALQALKALESEKDKLSSEDYVTEREALVARGAAAARELAEGTGDIADAPPEGESEAVQLLRTALAELGEAELRAAVTAVLGDTVRPAGALSPEWRGALWALGIVAVIGGFFGYATSESVDRRPGASMTGNQDLGTAPDQKAELEARVAADPSDLEAINALTFIAIQSGDAPGAMEWNRKAFELDAADPTARTWKALLAAAVGMMDRALEGLDAVVVDHPKHLDGWMYKGLVEMRLGQPGKAVASFEAAAKLDPGNPQLMQALAQARQMASAGGAPPPSQRPAPSGPAEVVFEGTVALSEDLQATLTGSETLYISVRDPAGGPPLGAKKLPVGDWPAAFTFTTADKLPMAGAREFTDGMTLKVAIDRDGNAMSRDDIVAVVVVPDMAMGTTGLELTLQAP